MNSEKRQDQLCVNIFCVMPIDTTEATCPKDLFRAHECCKKNGLNVTWVQEDACRMLKPTEENVFVLSAFVGPLFEFLRKAEFKIIGPQCLLVSLMTGNTIPNLDSPIFNTAMKGIVVTTTGFSSQENNNIQEKVRFMGGLYSTELSENSTHLIVKSVGNFSLSYKAATHKKVPVMKATWVDAVWSDGKENRHGTDRMFARYACPPFYGLVICISQIPDKDREHLKKIIKSNGGICSGQLEMGKTDILITTSAQGTKYTNARIWKIRCLKPEWIHSSLNEGYAVDPDMFIVQKNKSVQPTSILDSRSTETLDFAIFEKGQTFLNGCRAFISGFSDFKIRQKLNCALDNAGVARSSDINESLTHVIVGETIDEDWKKLRQLMHKPYVVTVEWVFQCLNLKRAVPEAAYIHPEFKNLIAYNKGNASGNPVLEASSTKDHAEGEEVIPVMNRPHGIFSGLTFQLLSMDTENFPITAEVILRNGGRVVKENAMYKVTEPARHSWIKDSSSIPCQMILDKEGNYSVDSLWIEKCVHEKRLVRLSDNSITSSTTTVNIPDINVILNATLYLDIEAIKKILELNKENEVIFAQIRSESSDIESEDEEADPHTCGMSIEESNGFPVNPDTVPLTSYPTAEVIKATMYLPTETLRKILQCNRENDVIFAQLRSDIESEDEGEDEPDLP